MTAPQRPTADTRSDDRKRFEQWYADNCFDFIENPIGSRQCGLQWEAWQAAQQHLDRPTAEDIERCETVLIEWYGSSIKNSLSSKPLVEDAAESMLRVIAWAKAGG